MRLRSVTRLLSCVRLDYIGFRLWLVIFKDTVMLGSSTKRGDAFAAIQPCVYPKKEGLTIRRHGR